MESTQNVHSLQHASSLHASKNLFLCSSDSSTTLTIVGLCRCANFSLAMTTTPHARPRSLEFRLRETAPVLQWLLLHPPTTRAPMSTHTACPAFNGEHLCRRSERHGISDWDCPNVLSQILSPSFQIILNRLLLLTGTSLRVSWPSSRSVSVSRGVGAPGIRVGKCSCPRLPGGRRKGHNECAGAGHGSPSSPTGGQPQAGSRRRWPPTVQGSATGH